jgi:hypothetical protein
MAPMDAFIKTLDIVVWPVAVIVIVAGLAWYLRDPLKRVVNRMTKAGLSGLEFAPPPSEQLPSPPKEGVASAPLQSSGGDRAEFTGVAPLQSGNRVREFIAGVKGWLSDQVEPAAQKVRSELDQTFGTNPSDQVEGLIYVVASLNVQLTHERHYNLIYGSQLRLMEQMVGVGVSRDGAQKIYEEAKAMFPDVYRNSTFEQWITFLVGSGLVTVGQGNYLLTPYGRGFLKYIVDRRLSPNKPF